MLLGVGWGREGRGILNIEHRTPNIEHRNEEGVVWDWGEEMGDQPDCVR